MGKIEGLKRDLESLRRKKRSLRSIDLERFAKRLGRTRKTRGKEPTYEMPGRFPLTIPSHPRTLAIGTACNILDQLELDLDHFEAQWKLKDGADAQMDDDSRQIGQDFDAEDENE